ncbi:MAG: hydrogenase small subunit [Firmicutes bacterium]|nr:hydrogenase small subunit [Bacillota bacterium]
MPAKDHDYLMEIYSHYREWLKNGAPAPPWKPPVIWLECNACSGDKIAFMNSQDPNLGEVLYRYIDVRFDNALVAAEGHQALEALLETAATHAGQFYLFVEGAIPLRDEGLYAIVAELNGERLTARDIITSIGSKAGYVIAAGTCASFGGPSAAYPNPSGSVGVRDVVQRPVINVSGCPNNPDWIMGTLFHLLFYGEPEVDEDGRPLLFYQYTVHRHCQRRSYFDRDEFADQLGDIECMFQLGCVGPRTPSDCPYRQWNGYVNWPVRANTPCIGCTTVGFPDSSMPFFVPLPEKQRPGPPVPLPGEPTLPQSANDGEKASQVEQAPSNGPPPMMNDQKG